MSSNEMTDEIRLMDALSLQVEKDLMESLINGISESLDDEDICSAMNIITDNKYSACLKKCSWDLFPIVVKHMNKETHSRAPDVFDCCEKILDILTDQCAPEEALLEFIEQTEIATNDYSFKSFLHILNKILMNLKEKRGNSLLWCLTAIKRYICRMPHPVNSVLEGSERTLLDSDSQVRRLTDVFDSVLFFIEPFVQEVSLSSILPADKIFNRTVVICFLLEILDKPFAVLDLEKDAKAVSKPRLLADKIMSLLSQLVSDKMKFIQYIGSERRIPDRDVLSDTSGDSFVSNIEDISDLSYGVFYYLLIAEHSELSSVPCVYDPVYIVQTLLHLAVILLENIENGIVRKGILLSYSLINLSPNNLTYMLLDSNDHNRFVRALSSVMIYNQSEENRKLCLRIFESYINKFEMKGRYLLILNIPNVIKHSGILERLIIQYKDMIHAAVLKDANKIDTYLISLRFKQIMNKYCVLPKDVETDLMEESCLIFGLLNFLYYVLCIDSNNVIGIWRYIDQIDKCYLAKLRKALDLSKAHYEMRKREIKSKDSGKGDGDSPVLKITVMGEDISHLSPKEQINIIEYALTSFLRMEMDLGRVNDLIIRNNGTFY